MKLATAQKMESPRRMKNKKMIWKLAKRSTPVLLIGAGLHRKRTKMRGGTWIIQERVSILCVSEEFGIIAREDDHSV